MCRRLNKPLRKKTCGLVETFSRLFGIPHQQAEIHLGMGIVGCHFDTTDRDHAHTGVLEFTRDELGQIPLDLVCHFEAPVRGG